MVKEGAVWVNGRRVEEPTDVVRAEDVAAAAGDGVLLRVGRKGFAVVRCGTDE